MLIALPLPPTNAEFRVRASGPALCLGSVHWTDRPIELDAAVQVLHRTSDFLATSHRYVRLVLPLAGEYLLEAIQIYDAFNLTSHMRTTCTSADLTPRFVGRRRVTAEEAASLPTSAMPERLWVGEPLTQLWTRHQQCSHISSGTYTPRGAIEEPRPLHNLFSSYELHRRFRWLERNASSREYVARAPQSFHTADACVRPASAVITSRDLPDSTCTQARIAYAWHLAARAGTVESAARRVARRRAFAWWATRTAATCASGWQAAGP